MKELSIGDKAKAYDEAREKIAIRFGSNVADEIFSQFEMSEDEKVRKALYLFVEAYGAHANYEVTQEEMLAWLEKQSYKDIQVIPPPFTFKDVLALQCCMETVKKVQEDKDLYNELLLLHNKVHDAYTITKKT